MSDNESAIEIEARGAAAGLNPMFGEWRQTFALQNSALSKPPYSQLSQTSLCSPMKFSSS
jgi:hypothetical protein